MEMYGIWDRSEKRFVPGISEDTKRGAWLVFRCRMKPAYPNPGRFYVRLKNET